MKKRLPYIVIFILLFLAETLIALFVHDSFVRPYIGDVIVVWVVYCAVQIVLAQRFSSYAVAFGTMIFAFIVEFLQKMHIADVLGIDNPILRTIIGTSYANADLICYVAGTAVTFLGIFIYNRIKAAQ